MRHNVSSFFQVKGLCLLALAMLMTVTMASPQARAQSVTTARTEATLLSDVATIASGKPFWAVLHIRLNEGWHTYWKNPGDSGTSPILNWTLPAGFSAGEIAYMPPERLPTGPLMDYGYNHDAYYLIPITPPALVNDHATMILMLKAQWLVCKDICVPEKAQFSLTLPGTAQGAEPAPSADAQLIDALVRKLPVKLAQPSSFVAENGVVRFSVKLPQAVETSPKSIQFFPVTDGIISNLAPQESELKGDTIAFTLKQGDAMLKEGEGVVSLFHADDSRSDFAVTLLKDLSASPTPPGNGEVTPPLGSRVDHAPESMTLAHMPPQEKLTLYTAVILAFLGGLILNLMPCVLPILSLKVLSVAKKAASQAAQVRKQALAYTAGVVVSFVVLAGVLIALQHVADMSTGWGFQMQSPVFVSLLSVLMLLVGLNLSGAFELPVLFGNTGGGKAAEDNALGSFLTGVLAVMVATPCSAPFMAPAIGFALTQSAGVVIAVFIALGVGLAAPFLLLSLFPRLARLLPKPGAWMLTLRQFLAFPVYLTVVWLLWVLGLEAGANGVAIAMLAMVAAGFCIFLLHRKTFFLRVLALLLAIGIVTGILHYVQAMPVKSAVSTASNNFSREKLADLRAQGKAVFVDATADWCITCKVNEKVALNRDEVRDEFEKRGIVTLVADWTHGEMDITEYLQSFSRSGVPLYVYYPPNGATPKVLPQILTPSIVLEAIHE